MKKTLTFAMTAALLASAPALAGDSPYLGTMGYVSMDTSTLVDLDIHMPFGDELDVFGFVPELQAQFGFGGGAVGINLGMAVAVPDQEGVDTGFWIGNFSVFGKGGYCTTGSLQLCFGGQLEVSLAPFEADKIEEGLAMGVGTIANVRYNRFGAEALVISPSVGASMKLSIIWAQAHLGTDIIVLYDCDDCDTEAALSFGVAGGVVLFDMLALGAGFRVLDIITEDNTDPKGVMDLIVKLMIGPVEPALILTFYLDDDTNDLFPATLSLGVAAKF